MLVNSILVSVTALAGLACGAALRDVGPSSTVSSSRSASLASRMTVESLADGRQLFTRHSAPAPPRPRDDGGVVTGQPSIVTLTPEMVSKLVASPGSAKGLQARRVKKISRRQEDTEDGSGSASVPLSPATTAPEFATSASISGGSTVEAGQTGSPAQSGGGFPMSIPGTVTPDGKLVIDLPTLVSTLRTTAAALGSGPIPGLDASSPASPQSAGGEDNAASASEAATATATAPLSARTVPNFRHRKMAARTGPASERTMLLARDKQASSSSSPPKTSGGSPPARVRVRAAHGLVSTGMTTAAMLLGWIALSVVTLL